MSNDENTPMEPIDVKPDVSLIPSASSDTMAPKVYTNDIYLNARYRDFHHFSAALKAYQKRTCTVYTVDGSSKLKDPNNPDLVKKFKYNYAILKCQHFGHSRHRGKGKRHHTTTLKLNCESYMRLKLNMNTMDMELTVLFEDHNHLCVPVQIDASGKKILPQVVENYPEVAVVQRRYSNRYTPYSTPMRAPFAAVNRSLPMASSSNSINRSLPMASSHNSASRGGFSHLPPTPRLVRKFFTYMDPNSDAARIQKLQSALLVQLAKIKSIPKENVPLRNAVAMKLEPLIQKFLPNSYITKQIEEIEAKNAMTNATQN